jgi:hypothetical protein
MGTHFPRGFGVLVEPVAEGLVVVDKVTVIEQVGVAVQLLGRVLMRVEVALETAQIRCGNAGPLVMAGQAGGCHHHARQDQCCHPGHNMPVCVHASVLLSP